MKHVIGMLAFALSLGSVGCVHLTPVGPMADAFGTSTPKAVQPTPGVTVTPPRDVGTGGPILQAPPAPPVPAILITPGEVKTDSVNDAMLQLEEELRSDRRAMEAMPRYAEVSVIPGRR
jgi:hypothetical protein